MKGSVTRRKPSLALNVVAVVVAINVAGAAVYVLTRHKNTQESGGAGGGSDATAPGEPTGDVSRALRAAGLAALESGRYEEAVKRFTEAAKSSKASPDLPQLMKIAMELRDRSSTTPAKATVTTTDMKEGGGQPDKADEAKPDDVKTAEDEKPDDKPSIAANGREDAKAAAKRREREREAAAREREREKQRRAAVAASSRKPEPAEVETAPAVVAPGTIIVSSTPSGLTVQLDGKAMDQTPLRLSAEPGSHEIALLHNNTVVFSRRLNVVSSSVQSLDPDVSAQVALLTPSRPEPVAAAAATQAAQTATPTSPGLTTPKPEDKPAAERGNTGETQEKPRNDLDPNALYAIANSSVGLSSVSAEQLADVYFGRSSTLNGRKVEPILRSPSGGAGAAFFRSVLRTNTRSYRESWQKLELAGKATPPPILSNASDVWRAVAGRSGAISFALGSELNGNATNLRPIRISY